MQNHDANAMRFEVVDDAVAAMLRDKTPAERIAMTSQANRTARYLIAGGIRFQHPDWTDDQIGKEVIRRMTRGAV